MTELSGDGAMSVGNRLRWLIGNAARNVTGCFTGLTVERVAANAQTRERARTWHGSPSRLVSDQVIEQELGMLSVRPIKILDVGCGSGLARRHFAAAGLSGAYLGIDIDDRFDRDADFADLDSRFEQGDAHTVELGNPDLVFSFSALEHIPRDTALLAHLRGALKSGGMQVHVVPGGWALLAYLWHGYRHYHRSALKARFPMNQTRVIAVGGPGSLVLHTLVIAVPEILLHINLRKRWPVLFGRLTVLALAIDRLLPIMPTSYVVIERAGGTP
jgi:SAM-dependent methyltransferase